MPAPVAAIERAFAQLADPVRAERMHAYQRGQFAFLGIPTPARRAAIAALDTDTGSAGELLAIVRALWRLPYREFQYAGIDLLARRKKTLGIEMVPPLLELVQQKPWWETVDGLASVIGALLRRTADHAHMDQALEDDCMWVRRVAMTHQLGWRLDTDQARLFRYARTLAPETDFFIRKAIGWALRDYARWHPAAVVDFVQAQRDSLSALTVREALKHQAPGA